MSNLLTNDKTRKPSKMNERHLSTAILALVATLALAGLVLYAQAPTGLAVYEQPANNKPVFLQTSNYLPDFNLCKQYLCTYPVSLSESLYAESEPSDMIGVDELTGNLLCGCPDGRKFYIRPDRIEVSTY